MDPLVAILRSGAADLAPSNRPTMIPGQRNPGDAPPSEGSAVALFRPRPEIRHGRGIWRGGCGSRATGPGPLEGDAGTAGPSTGVDLAWYHLCDFPIHLGTRHEDSFFGPERWAAVDRSGVLWALAAAAVMFGAATVVSQADLPAPMAGHEYGLPTWFVGDEWTYAVHEVTRSPDGTYTDTTGSITVHVASIENQTLDNVTYTVYNATFAGNGTSSGEVPIPLFGLRPYRADVAASGWIWSDNSSLALVQMNESRTAQGIVQMPWWVGDASFSFDAAETVTFSPAANDFDFPLVEGDAWSYNVTTRSVGYNHTVFFGSFGSFEELTTFDVISPRSASLWFNATENVTVPAGNFSEAARIEVAASGGETDVRFYHPAPKSFVAFESHVVRASDDYVHLWANLTGFGVQLAGMSALSLGGVGADVGSAADAFVAIRRNGVGTLVRAA